MENSTINENHFVFFKEKKNICHILIKIFLKIKLIFRRRRRSTIISSKWEYCLKGIAIVHLQLSYGYNINGHNRREIQIDQIQLARAVLQ